MSRQFDTTGGTDSITFSVGNAPPDQGPITIAVLAKATSTSGWTGWMLAGRKSGTAVLGFLTSNNGGARLFAENDFGNGVAGLSTSWRWYVMTKASGAAAPRMHIWDLSGAWSHTDNSATVADGTGPIDTLIVGSQNGSTNGWRGSLAVVAADAAAWSDAQVEARCTLAAADLFNASPGWMIRLNQASTATSITDDTSGGGNQSAITGTSVDANDPPGFDYSLSPPAPAQGSAAFTLNMAGAATGARTSAGSAPFTLGMHAAPTGARASAGSSAALLNLTGHATGSNGTSAHGSAAFVLNLALTTLGATGRRGAGGWGSLYGVLNAQRADDEWFRERVRNPPECPIHFTQLDQNSAGELHCVFGGHLVRRG